MSMLFNYQLAVFLLSTPALAKIFQAVSQNIYRQGKPRNTYYLKAIESSGNFPINSYHVRAKCSAYYQCRVNRNFWKGLLTNASSKQTIMYTIMPVWFLMKAESIFARRDK